MSVRLVLAIQEKAQSGLFTVYVEGKKIGQVYEDAPGCWLPYTPPKKEYGHPTVRAAVEALLTEVKP